MTEVSQPAPRVYGAICSVMAVMASEGIAKGRANQQQNYAFRGIDDIYASLCRVLSDNKLCILPFVQTVTREERQTKSGGTLNYTILTVDFSLVSAEDGSAHTIRTVGEAMDSADKSCNKAQSAALKYAAMQVFMIPTEGDNDADATTHELAPRSTEMPPEGWGDWARSLIAMIERAVSNDALDALKDGNKRYINGVGKEDAAIYKAIGNAFTTRRAVFSGDLPA